MGTRMDRRAVILPLAGCAAIGLRTKRGAVNSRPERKRRIKVAGDRSAIDSIRARLRSVGDFASLAFTCGIVIFLTTAPAWAEDWGMGAADREVARGPVFSPAP